MTQQPLAIQVAAPGRINLIGEHIDYNDGFVLPAAIDKRFYMSFTANGSADKCTVRSAEFDEALEVSLDQLPKKGNGWHNYVLGVLHEIQQLSDGLRGFDCTMRSEVPVGSGVSSSAALECGMAFGLNALFELGLSQLEIIKLSQRAEHHYVGTKCGIMDQFASVMGKAGHALLLDCTTLDYEHIPLQIAPYTLLLINTGVSHNLASGEYNTRREQCEQGLSLIKSQFGEVSTFRDVNTSMLEACRAALGATRYNRCRYVIDEIDRVQQAVQALRSNQLERFGTLLYETHWGLSKQYEVSCPELDFLVTQAQQMKGVLGARMMGGGFGGCTLNLVHQKAAATFLAAVTAAYKEAFNREAVSFEAKPSSGTTLI